jgi:murein DD-endopeptidase MepM/ murein hydrolase activator NlpD
MQIKILEKVLLFTLHFFGVVLTSLSKSLDLLNTSIQSSKIQLKKISKINSFNLKQYTYSFLLAFLALMSPLFLPFFPEGIAKNGSYAKTSTPKTRALKEIEEKANYLKRKIAETKAKEKIAISKLTQIQYKLSNTQKNLRDNKQKLSLTQYDLAQTEDKLTGLKSNYVSLQVEAERRIRQIYQGQRLRILEVLLKTPSLTDFLDTLYYQKLLVAQDRNLLESLSQESKNIEEYKDKLANQKIKIASVVNDIEKQKMQIAREHSVQSGLVRRLRTERGTFEQAERQLERESQQLISDINRLTGRTVSGGYSLPGTGVFAYPLRGRLTSPFGMRRHPMFKVVSFHSGVDLAAPLGTPIKASDSGKVIFTGWYGGYGKVVIVDHGKDFSTLYAHLGSTATSAGKTVSQGQVIGYEGRTGYSTGPHLHFEVRKSGRPQNPLNYLRGG